MNRKLIAVRKARKMTQADIATYLKMSQTQYQKRETGKIKISDQEWKDIAKLLDVSVEEIFEEYKPKKQRYLQLNQDLLSEIGLSGILELTGRAHKQKEVLLKSDVEKLIGLRPFPIPELHKKL